MELKDFRYHNLFNVTGKLSQTLSTIISEKEQANYICGILRFNTKEHKEWINDNEGHIPTLSSYKHLDESFQKDELQKGKPFSFFVIIEQETYRLFSQTTSAFSKKENIRKCLSKCMYCC